MSSCAEREAGAATELLVRRWQPDDDPGLTEVMQAQMARDPDWPPGYARDMDLAEWLGRPATLGRFSALDRGRLVGHVGVAPVAPGPLADLWRAALPPDLPPMAEICRLVVDPRLRRRGLSGLLTRKAVRHAIESAHVPVANALAHREASLAMMLAAGWTAVGSVPSQVADSDLVALIPPPKLLDAARAAAAGEGVRRA